MACPLSEVESESGFLEKEEMRGYAEKISRIGDGGDTGVEPSPGE
jgi:hypothetical protein